ncbi:MAG: hypothetical protein DRP00_06380, partial [Candidatus Aenigmatarchaeota archaeon]
MSRLKTLRSLIIIVLVLISFFYVGFHIPEIHEKSPLTAETTPTSWLSGWQYRKSHTIKGSTVGTLTEYQMKFYIYYGDYGPKYFMSVLHEGYCEATVYAVVGDCLYWGHNYGGGFDGAERYGRIYKTNLTTLNTTTLYTGERRAAWQGFYLNGNVYAVGEEHDTEGVMRSAVYIINTTDDSVTAVLHPNTGDCNEFVGVDHNSTHIVVGERVIGGVTTGSNWPNGGGVWAIPISTITDTATWQRTYEDPDHYEWFNIAYFNNKWYAVLGACNTTGAWKVLSSSDLVNWNTELNYTTQNYGNDFRACMIKCDSKLVVLAPVAATGTIHMFVFDGSTWTDYDLGLAESYNGRLRGMWDEANSKLIVFIANYDSPRKHKVYKVNLDGTELKLIASNLDGGVSHTYSDAGSMLDYNGDKFYAVAYAMGTSKNGGFYKLYTNDEENVVLLHEKCQPDFDDIRFTDSDGTTLLSYWVEEKIDNERAIIWVKIPSIPPSPETTTIYIYYGNTAVTSASDGSATFPLWFDDFDDDTIPTEYVKVNGSETLSESSSILYIETNAKNVPQGVYINITTPDNIRIIAKGRESTSASDTSENKQFGLYGRYTNTSYTYMLRVIDNDGVPERVKRLSKFVAGSVTHLEEKESGVNTAPGEWFVFDLRYYQSIVNATIRKEGWSTVELSGTDTELTSGKVGLMVGWTDFTWSFEFDWVALAKYVDP